MRAIALLIVVGCWQDRDIIKTEYVIQRWIQYTQCMDIAPPAEEPEIDCWNDPSYTHDDCLRANLLRQGADGIHLRAWACANLKSCGVICDPPKP
jgi:hypothetical protein